MKVRTRATDPVDLLGHRPLLVWLGSDRSVVGFGEAARFAAGIGTERFETAERAFRTWTDDVTVDDPLGLPGTGPVGFASFTFDARSHGSVLIVPEVAIGVSSGQWFVTTFDSSDATPYLTPSSDTPVETDRPRYAGASIPDFAYLEAVAAAVDEIRTGALEKVVLARDHALWSKRRFDTGHVLDRLRARYPGCLTFAVDGLVGASPELLVRRVGSHMESVVLAGTARRSDDQDEDASLARSLLTSGKDIEEHRWAVESVESILTPIARDLRRSPSPELLDLPGLRHLSTRFTADTGAGRTALTLAGMLHPTGAVGGFPTGPAIELIRRLEGMDRGRYAGPVGWIDQRGDGELAIALRCAEISGARARLFAGAGVVADSLPESELEETRLKLTAMLDALGR